jgi:hypothetical protein
MVPAAFKADKVRRPVEVVKMLPLRVDFELGQGAELQDQPGICPLEARAPDPLFGAQPTEGDPSDLHPGRGTYRGRNRDLPLLFLKRRSIPRLLQPAVEPADKKVGEGQLGGIRLIIP